MHNNNGQNNDFYGQAMEIDADGLRNKLNDHLLNISRIKEQTSTILSEYYKIPEQYRKVVHQMDFLSGFLDSCLIAICGFEKAEKELTTILDENAIDLVAEEQKHRQVFEILRKSEINDDLLAVQYLSDFFMAFDADPGDIDLSVKDIDVITENLFKFVMDREGVNPDYVFINSDYKRFNTHLYLEGIEVYDLSGLKNLI